jgi:predicted TIM-barrel fold metal-dependent hydrolase
MNQPVIDVHVHFGSPCDAEVGCYWSEKFESTLAYLMMKLITGNIFRRMTLERVKRHLMKAINGAKNVDQVVLLAMDEVYDKSGKKHREWTHLYVPNSYIVKLKEENPRILFGCSVHPFRKDWRQELDYCLENKAVVCKWIASSQQIDPTSDVCEDFYRKLAEHQLPLLYHAGPEYAIPTSDDSFDKLNNPKYIRHALDLGVPVILAHCSLPFFGALDFGYQDDKEDFFKLFEELPEHDWNLYADLSAITTTLRSFYLDSIKDNIPQDRLLFGSDYPIPATELIYTGRKNIFKWIRFFISAIQIKNPLDKNHFLISKMGFDPVIFKTANRLFSAIKY